MSFRNGLKWLAAAALGLGLAGCSAPAQNESQSGAASSTASAASSAVSSTASEEKTGDKPSVLCPAGAPALATLGLAEEGAKIEYVEGQDMLVSELSKTDGDYDLIVAPVNVGVKTWNDAGAYQLEGVLTWGNLYVVAQDDNWNEPGKTIALFGEQAVPGMVFTNLYPELQAQAQYYPSVAEASAALLSGKADSAMLAQPAAAGAINKGADNGLALNTVADLQSEWSAAHEAENNGYPQAALFVKKDKAADYADSIEALSTYIADADESKVEASINEFSAEQLGVPNAKIAASTWKQQNIHYVPAKDCQEDLAKFLDIFGITIPDGLIVQ